MRTAVCVVGGGPAGAMLGLLLARAGIEVTVLEKHGDFLRDFRGDTIHPATLDVLAELGLTERFDALPHHRISGMHVVTDTAEITASDLRDLNPPRYIAMVPQWDFLKMITDEAARHPNFRLLMNTHADGLIREGGRVAGVRCGDQEVRALLTVAADGRHSVLRRAAGLPSREFGMPMDVLWFRLPREPDDRDETFMRISSGQVMAAINRDAYWQFGHVVPKGGYARTRGRGIEALRAEIERLIPFLNGRTAGLDFDQISMLQVRMDRLRRWYRPGLLCVGDAAHAMSPVGGVGINLAIQDAVAAANRLAGPLRRGLVREADLAAVQRRRLPPTIATQRVQQLIQAVLFRTMRTAESSPPTALTVARRVPPLRRAVARAVAYGALPEHVRAV